MNDVMDLLDEIDDLIEEYWNNLHTYSKGNPEKVK